MKARIRKSGTGNGLAPRQKVGALLSPKNVVIVGATDKPGNWAMRTWRNLHRYDYPGAVYPMNPGRDRVWDTRCYRDFAELPEAPDHLFVVIPATLVAETLRAGAKAGARSATVISSGFDEVPDEQGQALGVELRAVIAETGLAVSGPNCLGNVNAGARFVTMPDDRPQRAVAGPVAIVGQSGGLVMAIKRTLEERAVDAGYIITSGNEAGLSTADYINYFAGDPTVKVIVSYIESVDDPAAFLAACRAAKKARKPVVVTKLGTSKEGRAAAMAHTGSLSGSMDAFDAVAGEAGVVRVRTLDDVVEVVEYLLHAPIPKGAGLGGITFSGGLRGLLFDCAATNGLTFPPLAPVTRRRLEKVLSVGTIIGNPLDSGFAALTSQTAYIECVETLLKDPGIDVLLLQEEIPRQEQGSESKISNLRAVNALAAKSRKPIAFVTMISHGLNDFSRELRAELPHIAFLQEADKSLRAVGAVVDYARRGAEPPAKRVVRPKDARVKLKRVLAGTARAAGPTALSEVSSKTLLKAYGIRAPKEYVATSADEAARLGRRIGFPVVLKAVSDALTHKSDAGGVLTGLESADAVRKGFRQIQRNVARHAPDIVLDGILVAEQVRDGLELVLGVSNDPEMGPVMMFGSGGVALELYRDVAFAAPPLDERKASALIDRSKAARLIAGYRGSPALDRKAAIKALIGLSQLATDLGDRLDSIDVNPFVLRRRGGVSLDGLVVLSGRKS